MCRHTRSDKRSSVTRRPANLILSSWRRGVGWKFLNIVKTDLHELTCIYCSPSQLVEPSTPLPVTKTTPASLNCDEMVTPCVASTSASSVSNSFSDMAMGLDKVPILEFIQESITTVQNVIPDGPSSVNGVRDAGLTPDMTRGALVTSPVLPGMTEMSCSSLSLVGDIVSLLKDSSQSVRSCMDVMGVSAQALATQGGRTDLLFTGDVRETKEMLKITTGKMNENLDILYEILGEIRKSGEIISMLFLCIFLLVAFCFLLLIGGILSTIGLGGLFLAMLILAGMVGAVAQQDQLNGKKY